MPCALYGRAELSTGRLRMLPEAMTALAAAGGTAVVQAATTDAWTGFRQRMAQWFGRGDQQRENAELERLDRTAGELESATSSGPAEAERAHVRHEAGWQARIEMLLENLADAERSRAAEELQTLLAQHTSQGGVSAGQGAWPQAATCTSMPRAVRSPPACFMEVRISATLRRPVRPGADRAGQSPQPATAPC